MLDTAAVPSAGSGVGERDVRHHHLLEEIHRSAHLLPSQGPITVFVHHNTLHALENLPFAAALAASVDVYGCEPYLAEEQYRQELANGRIRLDDLISALGEDLGDRSDELIGFLGTRFHFCLALLQYSLRTAPSAELRWVVAETDALRKFRTDAPAEVRKRLIDETRRWVMRERRSNRSGGDNASELIEELVDSFGRADIEHWSEATWEAFTLQLLWRICSAGVQDARPPAARPRVLRRHRDVLLDVTGVDIDTLVHDVLIRFTSAFLDQGFAHWTLPERRQGLYKSFLELYGESGGVTAHWLRGLRPELVRLRNDDVGPLESIEESLALLGIDATERQAFITRSLMALGGWAGMIWQLETNAEWAVWTAPPGTLIGFLAVRLLLVRMAAANVARDELGYRGPLAELRSTLAANHPQPNPNGSVQRAFMTFQLAQVLGWKPEDLHCLPADTWRSLVEELDAFSSFDRRRVFHVAFERTYRNQALDAVAAHTRRRLAQSTSKGAQPPAFQLICCIDEREESFRRHLEEVDPECETFGYAGFFGVAMYYRGLADAHSRPLCPVVIKPKHFVEEAPGFTFQSQSQRRAKTRRALGRATHGVHRGSRSLLGGTVTALFGPLASIPLVMRILLPRTTAQIRKIFNRFVQPPEVTQLVLERTEPEPGPENGHIGYSASEMADIVERTLRDNGLTTNFARLIILCGHGSSSLNNPHESAYNCGACSGGRGGPNARAFAQMANDPRVRRMLDGRGLSLPPETYFLGAFHNTCDDSVEFFDIDRLPPIMQSTFIRAQRSIDEARQRNAHERCRRFESIGLDITPELALRHVEERSEDLSQARPEYNHATNAMAIVGRRELTRGLYLDRRSFLASYDPTQDTPDSAILARILQAVIPVCAGISLEYYFSAVDTYGYGCGSKLPHNITSLLGVMEGAASDLRAGLSAQMTEIHEPMRILFLIETTPAAMTRIMDNSPVIAQLCRQEWVQLATISPDGQQFHVLTREGFIPYTPSATALPEVLSSVDWYRGWRDHLAFAAIRNRYAENRPSEQARDAGKESA